MTIKTRNRLFALGIVALPFVVLVGFIISEFVAPLPPIQPLPNPNGYNDFVKAGEMVSTNSWNYASASLEQLRETATANSNALALARAGLTNECRVPLQFTQTYSETHMEELSGLKKLAFGFAVESRLAELENRPGDAVEACLDTVRVGTASARGGTIIDELVGLAMEHIGTDRLQKIAGQLDAPTCRATASTLESLDGQRQTWNEVLQQEQDWSRRTFTGIRYEIFRMVDHKSLEKVYRRTEQKFQEQQLRLRQLMADLAARAWELDKGHPPGSLSELVPDYLKAVPQDPLTGTNLIYSPR